MIDYNQFAEKIKQKYPEHSQEDNLSLSKRYLDTYPVYKDRVSLDNVNQPTNQPQKGLLQNIVESPLIPGAFGAAGAAGGAILGGAPTLGLGSVAGAGGGGALGWGAGGAVQNSLKDILGYQTRTPSSQLTDVSQNAAKMGALSEAAYGTYGLANALLRPGAQREAQIGTQEVPDITARESVLQNLEKSKNFQMSDPETQQMARTKLQDILEKSNPLTEKQVPIQSKSGKPLTDIVMERNPNVSIKNIYDYLRAAEKTSKAYKGTKPLAEGTELASRAFREYLNTEIPKSAQLLNKYMTFLHSPLAKVLGVGGGALAGGELLLKFLTSQVKNIVSPND